MAVPKSIRQDTPEMFSTQLKYIEDYSKQDSICVPPSIVDGFEGLIERKFTWSLEIKRWNNASGLDELNKFYFLKPQPTALVRQNWPGGRKPSPQRYATPNVWKNNNLWFVPHSTHNQTYF